MKLKSSNRKVKRVLVSIVLFVLGSVSVNAAVRNNQTCGIQPGAPLQNAYGPWDYTNPEHQQRLPLVLQAHFTPLVERLVSGNTGSIMSDIDYTLRAIPNYHRALASMARHQRNEKLKFKNLDDYYTIECYFKRALYMQPNDATTLMLYGIHLHLLKDYQNAEDKYLGAYKLSPRNPEVQYNLGLLYLDLNNLEKAKEFATSAYQSGYPLEGLKRRLEKAGVSLNIEQPKSN